MTMTEDQASKFLKMQQLILQRVSVAEIILRVIAALFGLSVLALALSLIWG